MNKIKRESDLLFNLLQITLMDVTSHNRGKIIKSIEEAMLDPESSMHVVDVFKKFSPCNSSLDSSRIFFRHLINVCHETYDNPQLRSILEIRDSISHLMKEKLAGKGYSALGHVNGWLGNQQTQSNFPNFEEALKGVDYLSDKNLTSLVEDQSRNCISGMNGRLMMNIRLSVKTYLETFEMKKLNN